MGLKKLSLISLIIIIVIIIILLVIEISIKQKNNNDKDYLEEKIYSELEYYEYEITNLLNYLNNIYYNKVELVETEVKNEQKGEEKTETSNSESQETTNDSSGSSKENGSSDNVQEEKMWQIQSNSYLNNKDKIINWKYIKEDVEKLSNTWATVNIDLLKWENNVESLAYFSNCINNSIVYAKDENKVLLMKELNKMHDKISDYIILASRDEKVRNMQKIKSKIINIYVLVEEEKWNDAINIINEFNSNEYNFQNSNYARIQLMISEIRDSLELKNKDVFYIKYRNVMQEFDF